MPTSENALIENFFDRKRLEIIQAQSEKGLKASGKSASLLHVEQHENITQLIDETGSFEFQEFGRGPGRVPSWITFYEWLAFKKYGFNWKDEAERKRMAWAILISIKRRGTYTFRTRQETGVLTDILNDESINELSEQISSDKVNEILTDVTRIFEQ